MASANPESLWRKIIESMVGAGDVRLNGTEVKPFGRRALDAMLHDRLLIQEAIPDDLGICGCINDECVAVLERIDGKYWSVCPSAQRRPLPLSEDDITFYHLNFKESLKRLRTANGLEDQDISTIASENAYFLGKTEVGIEPLSALFCRRLNRRNATDLFHKARGAISEGKILLAAANGFSLNLTESRVADSLGIYPIRFFDFQEAPDSLRLDWPTIVSKVLLPQVDETQSLLFVDSSCHLARYKNHLLDISAKPFEVLVALAKAAKRTNGSGYVLIQDIRLQLAGQVSTVIDGSRLSDNVRELRNYFRKMTDDQLISNEEADIISTKKTVGYRLTIPHEQIVVI